MKRAFAIACSALLCGIFFAQNLAAQNAAAFPDFTQTQGKHNRDGFPITGATLCILGQKDLCYQMPSATSADDAHVTQQFGLNPHAERYSVPGGGSWVLFSAMYYAGGSTSRTRLAMLRYQSDGTAATIVNLLPDLVVTDISDYDMWLVPQISPYPMLVDADYFWDPTSTEPQSSPHNFNVTVWKFDPQQDHYVQAFTYRTTKKYLGGSRVSPTGVLRPERDEILLRLMPAR